MKTVLYILFGWTLTTTATWALGTLLLRRLRLRLHRSEEILLGFVTGAPILSALIFAVCALHVLYKGVLLAIAIASFLLVARSQPCTPPEEKLAPFPRMWKLLFALVFGTFGFLYFFNALAPEMSPDGAGYHIPMVAHYYRSHGFVPISWDMYANLSQGIELLFLMAFAFGRNSATAMVHFSFLLALPWLMLTYARRFGFPVAGVAAAILVFASPIIGIDGTSAYNDVGLAVIVFGLYYVLQLWDRERDGRLLVPAGILAGFCFAVKYSAGLAVPYAVLFVAWKSWRRNTPILRPALLVASLALMMMAPWLLKNWLFVNNPLAPFANSLFPNRYLHISAEQDWRQYLKTWGLASYKEIPWELTVSGERLQGIFGPVFLLAPVALLALYNPAGRQLLLAAAVFGATYFTNIEVRFLINVVLFLTLALALVLQNIRGLLLALVLLHAILSYPVVLKLYCSQYAWRLRTLPIGPALRRPPEDVYLSQNSGYLVDRLLDQEMGPNDRVFSFMGVPESYTSRQVLVQYLAAQNEVLGDILLMALIKDFQPNKVVDFHFPEQKFHQIRVVQIARPATDQWDVNEIRVYDRDRELPRESQWRLRARPNPWDVQLAFDNALVTRWRSWQTAEPGMFIEIDLGAAHTIDCVRVETRDGTEIKMRLEALDTTGKWSAVNDQPLETIRTVAMSLRRSATEELKARGVRYVLIDSSNYGASDFFQHSAYWGLKEVGRRGETRLYHIE